MLLLSSRVTDEIGSLMMDDKELPTLFCVLQSWK